jgi:2',3'-cyclic-nucleotide 2'-phosphodiesterase (5'-nucleotidase family)
MKFNFIHTSDIHGNFVCENSAIDFSSLSTYIKSKKQANNNVSSDVYTFAIDSGDATQGSLFVADSVTPDNRLISGLNAIEVFNRCDFDYQTFGNHEFDNISKEYGDELKTHLNAFNGQYLSCNTRFAPQGSAQEQNYISYVTNRAQNGEYAIKTVSKASGNYNILFIGLTIPTITLLTENMKGFRFVGGDKNTGIGELSSYLNSVYSRALNQAKSDGIFGEDSSVQFDLVVGIFHLGANKRHHVNTIDLLSNKTGADKSQLNFHFDLILDGHSHEAASITVSDTLGKQVTITNPGTEAQFIYDIEVQLNGKGAAPTINVSKVSAAEVNKLAKDSDTQAYISLVINRIDGTYGKVISSCANQTLWGGTIFDDKPYVANSRKLDATRIAEVPRYDVVRYSTTNLGKLVCDALIDHVRNDDDISKNYKDIQIVAGMNGGAIRQGIRSGSEISAKLLYTLLPSLLTGWSSGFVVCKMKMPDLKKVLEHSVSQVKFTETKISASSGAFLNTSGVKYTVEWSQDLNNWIFESDAEFDKNINFQKSAKVARFENDEKVLVCVSKYIFGGGDGYSLFKSAEKIKSFDTPVFSAVAKYIKKLSTSKDSTVGRLHYPCIAEEITYKGISGGTSGVIEVQLKSNAKAFVDGTLVVVAKFTSSGYDSSNLGVYQLKDGAIKCDVSGAGVYCVGVLENIASTKKNVFAYGEFIFDGRFMELPGHITLDVSKPNRVNQLDCALDIFRHTLVQSDASHLSAWIAMRGTDNVNQRVFIQPYDDSECTLWVMGDADRKAKSVQYVDYLDGSSAPKRFTNLSRKQDLDYSDYGTKRKFKATITDSDIVRAAIEYPGAQIDDFYIASGMSKIISKISCFDKAGLSGIRVSYADGGKISRGVTIPSLQTGEIALQDGEYITYIEQYMNDSAITSLSAKTNFNEGLRQIFISSSHKDSDRKLSYTPKVPARFISFFYLKGDEGEVKVPMPDVGFTFEKFDPEATRANGEHGTDEKTEEHKEKEEK